MRKMIWLASAGLLVANVAGAATVAFGGRNSPDGDGTVSNRRLLNGFGVPTSTFVNNNNLGFNSTPTAAGCDTASVMRIDQSQVASDGLGGSALTYVVSDNDRGVTFAPAGGSGCYLNVDTFNGTAVRGTGYSDVFVADDVNGEFTPIRYFGFLWGSPDPYNFIQLANLNGDGTEGVLAASQLFLDSGGGSIDTNGDGRLDGAEAYAAAGLGVLPTADVTGISFFINFTFAPGEIVTGLRFGVEGNCCFEFDNVASVSTIDAPGVVVTAPATSATPLAAFFGSGDRRALAPAVAVAEPAPLALFGLGLLGVSLRRRRGR